MIFRILYTFLRIRLNYFMNRKIEFFNRIANKWFGVDIQFNLAITLVVLLNLFKYALYGTVIYTMLKVSDNYLTREELLVAFFFYIFIFPIIGKIGMVNHILSPVDDKIVFTSPLNNKQIFLLNYLSFFTYKKLGEIPYLILTSMLIWSHFKTLHVSYWLFTASLYIGAEFLGFGFVVLLCILNINRFKKGYRLGSFVYVHFIGVMLFFISFYVTQTILSWITAGPTLRDSLTLRNLLKEGVQTLKILIDLKMNVFTIDIYAAKSSLTFFNFNAGLYLTGYTLLTVVVMVYAYKRAGSWYRTSWQYNTSGKDWLTILYNLYLACTKNLFTIVQIKSLFRNRTEIASNYPFFFFNHFNYIWIGMAVGTYNISFSENPAIRLTLLFLLFNIISRDSFGSGVIWFPSILRFDGEGKSLQLYKLSGKNLLHVYNAKINLQRFMGLPDFFILFTLFVLLLKPTFYETAFIISLCLLNFICSPHMKTLPSYLVPHLDRQHFTEVGEYIENELWEKNIEKKTQYLFGLLGWGLLILLIMLNVNLSQVYYIGVFIHVMLSIIGIFLIRSLLKKYSYKVNENEIKM